VFGINGFFNSCLRLITSLRYFDPSPYHNCHTHHSTSTEPIQKTVHLSFKGKRHTMMAKEEFYCALCLFCLPKTIFFQDKVHLKSRMKTTGGATQVLQDELRVGRSFLRRF
jgi:hypothetical protein